MQLGNLYTALRMSGLAAVSTATKCHRVQKQLTSTDRQLAVKKAALVRAQAKLTVCQQKHPTRPLQCRALSRIVDSLTRQVAKLEAKRSEQAQQVYSLCQPVPPPPPPPPPPPSITCGTGTVLNAAGNACVPVTVPPAITCGTGTVLNAAGTSCVPVTVPPPPPPVTCGSGFVFDALRNGCVPIGSDASPPPPSQDYPYPPTYGGGGGGGVYSPVFSDIPEMAPGFESFETGAEGAMVPGGVPGAAPSMAPAAGTLAENDPSFNQMLPLEYSDEYGKMKVLRVVIASQAAAAPVASGGGGMPGALPTTAIEAEEMQNIPGF